MYVYSRLSSTAVKDLLLPSYRLGAAAECRFYVLGLHDNYLVEDESGKYILRVYRNDWRSRYDVLFELDFLTFLADAGDPVAYPLPTASGERCLFHPYPEGERAVALFRFAPGVAPSENLTFEQSRRLGEAVAQLHLAADDYSPKYSRQELTVEYLLDASVRVISGFLDSGDAAYLSEVQASIKAELPELPRVAPYFGVCHGDVNPNNLHFSEDGGLTVFDFDQCGYGWRAFEIGKFMSSILARPERERLLAQFVAGYESVRPLTPAEVCAISLFTKISVIWVLAIHAYNAERIGYKYLDAAFWKKRLSRLKELGEK